MDSCVVRMYVIFAGYGMSDGGNSFSVKSEAAKMQLVRGFVE